MARFWNRDFLTRRIDRCYLIAAGAKNPEKRKVHLELARHYRRILTSLIGRNQSGDRQAEDREGIAHDAGHADAPHFAGVESLTPA